MKQVKKQKNTKRGFSIMELMLAVFVLTIGITGALKLIVSTISNSISTRNQVIASELVQEGVELVRNIRDNNMLYALADLSRDSDISFKTGLPGGNGANDCTIDIFSTTGLTCSGAYPIYLNPVTNTYSHDSSDPGVETIFRRSISVTYETEAINGNDDQLSGMEVVSTVWWDGSASAPLSCDFVNKCIRVIDYLPKRD